MILWLTGNSGSGKSTLATAFRKVAPQWVNLDGDAMRRSISVGVGFSKDDRHAHNLRVARLAKVLDGQGHNVIVSVIAPFRDTRREIENILPNVIWVYMKRKLVEDEQRPYEPPVGVVTLHVDETSLNEEVSELRRVTQWT